MAYYEKYRKEITQTGGTKYRISIYENRSSSLGSGYPYEIGGFVAANLVLQGQQSDVFQPIVKTSLELILVDVYDNPTYTQSGTTVKQGQWEEFFTPDSTKYKVILSKVSGSTVTPVWTGYITPDSYEEQLIYHGTISVIARDNLGHLNDLDFDGTADSDGMVSVGSLVTQALAKVGAMGLKDMTSDYNSGNHILCRDADRTLTAVNLKGLYVTIDACRGNKWYKVLEDVLESTGLTLRYAFDNTFRLAEMGMIPEYLDGTRSGGTRTFKMLQGTGRRAFVPAARMIEESFDASYGGLVLVETNSTDYQDATVTMGGSSRTVSEPVNNHPFRRTGAIGMVDPLSGHYYNPRVGSIYYTGKDMFVTALKSSDSLSSYGSIKATIPIVVGGANLTMKFRIYVGAYSRDGDYISGGTIFTQQAIRPGRPPSNTYSQTMTARYKVAFYNGTTRKYMDDTGSFTTNDFTFQSGVTSGFSSTQGRYGANFADVEKEIRLPNESGQLEITFLPFLVTNNHAPDLSAGAYHGRINGLEITQDDESWKGYDLQTIYDEKNNVVLSRRPRFGQVSDVINPRIIRNGLYMQGSNGQYPAAGVFYWRSKDTDNLRLAVLIHQQMLQFFSRPEKQISADIIDATDGLLSFNNIYLYGGEKYIIQTGSYDLVNNRMNGVTMRTWKSWASLWGDAPVENYLTVGPSSINLTQNNSASVTVSTNASWRIKTLPSGLSASVSSGSAGNTSVTIQRSTFSGSGTIVFETTDHALTAEVSVLYQSSQATELTMTSVGMDLENMEFANIPGIYYIELDFDPDIEGMVLLNFPNWIHFPDYDPQSGIVYTPGVYTLYCDELPSSSPRTGTIDAQGAGSGTEVSLTVTQIG